MKETVAKLSDVECALTEAKKYTDELSGTLASPIKCTAEGTNISIKNASEAPLSGLRVYGKTTQGANPSPEYPQPFVSVGDKGNIEIKLTGAQLLPTTTKTATAYNVTLNIDKHEWSLTGTSIGGGGRTVLCQEVTLPAGTYKVASYPPMSLKVSDGESFSVIGGSEFTLSEERTVLIGLNVENGVVYDKKFKVMLNSGATASPYEPYSTQTLTLSTPNGLLGIPVSSGGNYTDKNGQQWLCDEIDFARGKYVKRIGKIASYNGETISTPYMSTTGQLSEGANIYYILAEPIETDLSAEEIAAFKVMHTNKPTTNIFNDEGAHMAVEYTADTKAYIDNKFTELQNAILSTGGNV